MERPAGASRAVAALLGAAVAAACGETIAPEALDDAFIRDVALIVGDATIEDVTLWDQPLSFGPAPVVALHAGGPAAGLPGGAGGWTGNTSGTRSVTFLDPDGVERETFDALTTEAIRFEQEIAGAVSREGWSAHVHRLRGETVSGLTGDEALRTWDGTATEQVAGSRHIDDGLERWYDALGSVEYQDVVAPIPGSDPSWPVSGTIRRTLTVTRTEPPGDTRTFHVVLTFDGTPTATAEIDGDVFEIDLSTGAGQHPIERLRGG